MKILLISLVLAIVAIIGLPQISAEQVNLMHSWDLNKFHDLQLTYVVDSEDDEFHTVVDEAVKQWEIQLHPIITFAKTRNVDRADIYFHQVSQKKIDKVSDKYDIKDENQGITEAFDSNSDGYTDYVLVHILNELSKYDKYITAVHEMGHAMGLEHTFDDKTTVMNPDSDETIISKCEVFGVFYTNGLGPYLDGELYKHKKYKNLIDECIVGSYSAAKYEDDDDDDNEDEDDAPSIKEICHDYGGAMEDGGCDIEDEEDMTDFEDTLGDYGLWDEYANGEGEDD